MLRNKLFLKLLAISLLILVLLIPLSMTHGIVLERSYSKMAVANEIANSWTGDQRLIGPLLVVNYELRYTEKVWNEKSREYEQVERSRWENAVFMPQKLVAAAAVETSMRSRGIYDVPVYESNWSISGHFPVAEIVAFRESTKHFSKFGSARVTLAIADVRGIGKTPSITIGGETVRFEPGVALASLGEGIQARAPELALTSDLDFSLELELRGSRSLRVSPVASDAEIRLSSNWPHPKFSGSFLPATREVTGQGFAARWAVTAFSTSAEQNMHACLGGSCEGLRSTDLGVELIEPVDLYAKAIRATKHGILFVVLTFVAFFLTETLSGKELHPVQYILVGFSLCIFYLLLISLAEHIGFARAYLSATLACAGLIATYLSAVFASVKKGIAYSAGISGLYGMLYVILQSEDFALLMGSLLLFSGLTLVMLLTRRINWFDVARRSNA